MANTTDFNVRPQQPNKETVEAMLEAERIARDPSIKRYSDVEEALEELKEELEVGYHDNRYECGGEELKNAEAWDYAIGMIKMDGLEPTEDFKRYIEKEKSGEATMEDAKRFLDKKYKMKESANT